MDRARRLHSPGRPWPGDAPLQAGRRPRARPGARRRASPALTGGEISNPRRRRGAARRGRRARADRGACAAGNASAALDAAPDLASRLSRASARSALRARTRARPPVRHRRGSASPTAGLARARLVPQRRFLRQPLLAGAAAPRARFDTLLRVASRAHPRGVAAPPRCASPRATSARASRRAARARSAASPRVQRHDRRPRRVPQARRRVARGWRGGSRTRSRTRSPRALAIRSETLRDALDQRAPTSTRCSTRARGLSARRSGGSSGSSTSSAGSRGCPPPSGPQRAEELVGSVLALFPAAPGASPSCGSSSPGFPVLADRDQVLQVLLNLVRNALDAMPSGGTLGSVARRAGGAVTFWVSDSRAGIRPEDRPRVFEPYFTTKDGGTGLGLAIAQRIAEEHGGALDSRRRPAKGTTFTLHASRSAINSSDGRGLQGPPCRLHVSLEAGTSRHEYLRDKTSPCSRADNEPLPERKGPLATAALRGAQEVGEDLPPVGLLRRRRLRSDGGPARPPRRRLRRPRAARRRRASAALRNKTRRRGPIRGGRRRQDGVLSSRRGQGSRPGRTAADAAELADRSTPPRPRTARKVPSAGERHGAGTVEAASRGAVRRSRRPFPTSQREARARQSRPFSMQVWQQRSGWGTGSAARAEAERPASAQARRRSQPPSPSTPQHSNRRRAGRVRRPRDRDAPHPPSSTTK